ncbi:MAG TPA: hypothetical protein VF008_19270 [Niastella sp.]
MKKLLVIIAMATWFASCKSISMQVAVPDKFATNATQMKVSGLNHWPKPKLTFGNYRTSKVKTGWVVSTGGYDSNYGRTTAERLLKTFNVGTDNITKHSRNKYQYTIQDGDAIAEVYCIEKTVREEVTTYTPLIDFGKTKNYQYSFSAIILPQTLKNEQWQLVFYNSYDSKKDTARKFWELPYVEHEGYVTNGKLQIDIRPIFTARAVGKDGKELKTLIKLLMAYELKIDNGVIGVIDVFNKNIWIYNDLDKDMKLIIASVASAILMRKQAEGIA